MKVNEWLNVYFGTNYPFTSLWSLQCHVMSFIPNTNAYLKSTLPSLNEKCCLDIFSFTFFLQDKYIHTASGTTSGSQHDTTYRIIALLLTENSPKGNFLALVFSHTEKDSVWVSHCPDEERQKNFKTLRKPSCHFSVTNTVFMRALWFRTLNGWEIMAVVNPCFTLYSNISQQLSALCPEWHQNLQ